MPKINRGPRKVEAEVVETPAAPPAKNPDAAPTTATAIAVKSSFGESNLIGSAVVPISAPTSESVPWLKFFDHKAKNAQQVQRALPNIDTGHPYVQVPGPDGNARFYSVSDFLIVSAREFYTDTAFVGGEMVLRRATLTEPEDEDPDMKREIVATILVVTPDGVVPAVASFRSGKAPAAQTMVAAVRDTGNWAAVVGTLRTSTRTVKKGKNAGHNYTLANADTRPIDAVTAQKLRAWGDDPAAQTAAGRVQEAWKNKCRDIESVAADESAS